MTRTATSAPRSRRAWKATAATGVAVALLAAGGATFAEWSDSQKLTNAATIQSGSLALDAGTPGMWTNAAGTDVTAHIADYLIVPGDSLTYRETLHVEATGDLLAATVSTTMDDLSGAPELVAALKADATMTLNGAPVTGLTAPVAPSDDEQKLDVAVTLAFDADTTAQMAQGQSVNLNAMKVKLEQNAVTAAG